MITILEEPQTTPISGISSTDPKGVPVPVTDCARWCLQLDDADVVTTAGGFATVVVSFPTTTTVVSPGTPFKIWGYDFTVNNSVNFTSNTFKTVTGGRTTADNFTNMIRANFFFAREVSVVLVDTGSAFVVTITWNDCREQANFTSAAMSFLALTATGATPSYTNGVSPVYIDGVKVVTQLIYNSDLNTPLAVSELEGHDVDRLCDSGAPVCVDYRTDIEGQLQAILPELSPTSFTTAIENSQSLMKVFQLNYGWVYREDCAVKSGTFTRSGFVVGINAAFPINDPYGMRRYWYNHPDGYAPGQTLQKFLTTQPSGVRLCDNSYAWLWLTNNFSEVHGLDYKLRARYVVSLGSGVVSSHLATINDSATDLNKWYAPVCFNVSPGKVEELRAALPSPSNFDSYTVQVVVTDSDNNILETVTELVKYLKIGCDCSVTTDVYFLTPAGGYSTMVVEVSETSITREGTEVNLYSPCAWDFDTRNKQGGRTLVNLRNYEKKTIRATALSNTDADKNWFQDFVLSPVKYIKETSAGYDFARKIIVDPGTVVIRTVGDALELSATVYMQDINVQNPANQ